MSAASPELRKISTARVGGKINAVILVIIIIIQELVIVVVVVSRVAAMPNGPAGPMQATVPLPKQDTCSRNAELKAIFWFSKFSSKQMHRKART